MVLYVFYIHQNNQPRLAKQRKYPLEAPPPKKMPKTLTEKENKFSMNGAVQEQGGQEER